MVFSSCCIVWDICLKYYLKEKYSLLYKLPLLCIYLSSSRQAKLRCGELMDSFTSFSFSDWKKKAIMTTLKELNSVALPLDIYHFPWSFDPGSSLRSYCCNFYSFITQLQLITGSGIPCQNRVTVEEHFVICWSSFSPFQFTK